MTRPADCLVAHWDMDDVSGVDVVDSVGGLTCVAAGSPVQTAGKIGNCIDFEGGDGDNFDLADNATVRMANSYTWGGTVWLLMESKAATMHPVGKRKGGLDWWMRYDAGDDRYEFVVWTNGAAGNTEVLANTFGSPTTATWHFVAYWFDHLAQTINISVNGGAANSASHTGTINGSAAELELGAGGGGEFWDGLIDEVALFKNGFPSEYLAEMYNGGAGVDKTALLAIGASSGGDPDSVAAATGRSLAVAPYDNPRLRGRRQR